MGLFTKLFGSESDQEEKKWKMLSDSSELASLKISSHTRTQLIFKHSTRCGISSMTLRSFEKMMAGDFPNMDFYLLDLLQHRNISDQIASLFEVPHESPQVLILRNGVVVAHASHYEITRLNLDQYA